MNILHYKTKHFYKYKEVTCYQSATVFTPDEFWDYYFKTHNDHFLSFF